MTVEQAAELWLSRYGSPNTRSAYAADVRTYLSWFDEAAEALVVTPGVLARYRRVREASGVAPSTVDRQFAALRAFYAAACELGVCSASPFASRPTAVAASSRTLVLTAEEVERLWEAASAEPRTAVLVHLLLGHGMRLAEVLALDHADISGRAGSRHVRVRRHGRAVKLPLDAAGSASIGRLQRASTGDGALLRADSSRAGTGSARLTRYGADRLLKIAARAAAITGPVSANVLRRTHVARSHRDGVHIEDIRHRMGHRDVRTTRRYLAPDQQPPTKPTPT